MIAIYLSMLDDVEDKKRFESLYLLYRQDMYAIAYKILNNVYDSEDAVHQAFLRIANNFEKISEIDCPKTRAYIVIIVKNVSIDIYRKNKRKSNNNISIDTKVDNMVQDDNFFNEVNYKSLVSKICCLPNTYKDVLYLKYVNGYNNKEISKLLNISQNAVYKRIQRAKSLLYELLKEEL
jgi:RNA polymerase sigma-70 factor (ECF subfamily)